MGPTAKKAASIVLVFCVSGGLAAELVCLQKFSLKQCLFENLVFD
jgi:hypothetical protein